MEQRLDIIETLLRNSEFASGLTLEIATDIFEKLPVEDRLHFLRELSKSNPEIYKKMTPCVFHDLEWYHTDYDKQHNVYTYMRLKTIDEVRLELQKADVTSTAVIWLNEKLDITSTPRIPLIDKLQTQIKTLEQRLAHLESIIIHSNSNNVTYPTNHYAIFNNRRQNDIYNEVECDWPTNWK